MADGGYEIGETVWAKAKAKDEWWPCQKCDAPDEYKAQLNPGPGEHCVFFFGTKNFGKVKFIEKFDDNFETFSRKSKKKSFLAALEDVEEYNKGEDVGAPVPSAGTKGKGKAAAPKPPPSPKAKATPAKKTPPAKGKKGGKEEKEEEEKEEEKEEEEEEEEKQPAGKKRKAPESNGKKKGKKNEEEESSSESESDAEVVPPKKAAKAAASSSAAKKLPPKKAAARRVEEDSDSEAEEKKKKDEEEAEEGKSSSSSSKQPSSAFFNFCSIHRPKLMQAGVHITELSAKLNDMWEQAEYAAERKQLEEQYQAQMEKAKEEEQEEEEKGKKVPAKEKREKEREKERAREESEKSSLLERLTSLSSVLRKSAVELSSAISKQTEELERLKKRPMPGGGAPSQAFLQNLKLSEVGRVVAKLKKHNVGAIKDRATELRLKWEELLEQGSVSVFSPKGVSTPRAGEVATPKGGAVGGKEEGHREEGKGEEGKGEGSAQSGGGGVKKEEVTNGLVDGKGEGEKKQDGDVVMGEGEEAHAATAAAKAGGAEAEGGGKENGALGDAAEVLEGVDAAALKEFEDSDEEGGKKETS